jgi:histidinol-phosphate aminotransferase
MNEYSTGKPISEVQLEFGFDKVYKLNANENPVGPSYEVVRDLEALLPQLNRYPDAGSEHLRNALSIRLGVKSDQIMIGSGGDEILRLVAEAFIDPEDEAIAIVPYFSLYKNNVQLMNGKLVEVRLATFGFDPEVVLSAITHKTKLIFLTSPNNPTGTIITQKRLIEFLDKVPSEIQVLLDEAYCDYAQEYQEYPNGVAYIDKYKNLMVLRTFSKSFGLAGLRVGYVIASANVIEVLNKIRLVFNVNVLAQAAALAALQDPGHLQESLLQNRNSLEVLYNYFETRHLEYVRSYGNFVFVNFNRPILQVIEHLSRDGIFITPGTLWGYETWARISSGSDEAMTALIQSLDHLLV